MCPALAIIYKPPLGLWWPAAALLHGSLPLLLSSSSNSQEEDDISIYLSLLRYVFRALLQVTSSTVICNLFWMYEFTVWLNFTHTVKVYLYNVVRLRPTKKTTRVKYARITSNEHGLLVWNLNIYAQTNVTHSFNILIFFSKQPSVVILFVKWVTLIGITIFLTICDSKLKS